MMGRVKYSCLVCEQAERIETTKESYQEVLVCPQCNGAFVDLWHISKYKTNCSDKEMNRLRERFVNDLNHGVDGAHLIVVAVQLPTGAIETITNTENISDKLGYYFNAYDHQFKLKANLDVKIVGYMIV